MQIAHIIVQHASSTTQKAQTIILQHTSFTAQMAQIILQNANATAPMAQIFKKNTNAITVTHNQNIHKPAHECRSFTQTQNLFSTDCRDHRRRKCDASAAAQMTYTILSNKVVFAAQMTSSFQIASSRHRWHRSNLQAQNPCGATCRSSFEMQVQSCR